MRALGNHLAGIGKERTCAGDRPRRAQAPAYLASHPAYSGMTPALSEAGFSRVLHPLVEAARRNHDQLDAGEVRAHESPVGFLEVLKDRDRNLILIRIVDMELRARNQEVLAAAIGLVLAEVDFLEGLSAAWAVDPDGLAAGFRRRLWLVCFHSGSIPHLRIIRRSMTGGSGG